MDTPLKDGPPSQQTRATASRASSSLAVHLGTGVGRNKELNLRPSTGRLTSPLQERRVALRGQLTRLVASCCIARLVVLATEDQRRPIVIHIDSPGGSASELMGILSTMNGIRCPVITFCRREAFGPAAILAAHGLRGYRFAAPGCRFSLKISSLNGRSSINVDSLVPLLAEVLTKDARKRQDEVLRWLKSGAEFGAPEALAMGLIDAVSDRPILPGIKQDGSPALLL